MNAASIAFSSIAPAEIISGLCHTCSGRLTIKRSCYSSSPYIPGGHWIIAAHCDSCGQERQAFLRLAPGPLSQLERMVIDLKTFTVTMSELQDIRDLPEIQDNKSQAAPAAFQFLKRTRTPLKYVNGIVEGGAEGPGKQPTIIPDPQPVVSAPQAPRSVMATAITARNREPLSSLPPEATELPTQAIEKNIKTIEIENPSLCLGEIIRKIQNFESEPLALPETETEEAHWETGNLKNFSIVITGSPGSGKTQVLRVLIDELAKKKLAITIFDFKNDYSEESFIKSSIRPDLTVYDVNRNGLPFNPLLLVENKDGECHPIRLVHELGGILGRIFTMGDQQTARLKRAISKAYEDKGIDVKNVYKWAALKNKHMPNFNDVQKTLESDSESESVLNKISFLLDLKIFPDASRISFEDLINNQVVLSMHALPDDRIKGLVAEFLIMRLHSYLIKNTQPRKLKHMLVLDEAWRVANSERLAELAREGRAFGVGIAIGTQYPSDIPEALAGCCDTSLFMHSKEPEHQKVIAKILTGNSSGPSAAIAMQLVAGLQRHEGILKNSQFTTGVVVKTIPHYERVKLRESLRSKLNANGVLVSRS